MPFVNVLGQKRGRSQVSSSSPPSNMWLKPRLSKISTLERVVYDGTASNSLESTSTSRSISSVKSQIKKGVSSVKIMLGIGDKTSDISIQHHIEGAFGAAQPSPTTYRLENDSNATTLYRPLKLRLTGMAHIPENHESRVATSTVKCAPFPSHQSDARESDSIANLDVIRVDKHGHRAIRRSQSVPGLQRRLSQKLQQAFGNPNTTVVVRSELRSRPSVHTLNVESNGIHSGQMSSTPSIFYSGSGSPRGRIVSTPLTSDPVTPTSVAHLESVNSFEFELPPYVYEGHVLTPIPEIVTLPTGSIQTVEAAAAAKVFFEMHFNYLLKEKPAREVRKRELKRRLRELQLPIDTQSRARNAWQRTESENLRQTRVLRNTKNRERAVQGVTVGGFDLVKVLGKGSFGVVRLVTAKNAKSAAITEVAESHRPLSSRLSQSSLMISKRRTFNPSRTQVYAMKVICKSDMIRSSQEGHLRAERDLLVAAEGSKWIIPLIAAFQDQKHLYLVMEFCIGGDFLGLLIRRNILPEHETRFYVAEMILCVEEAHRMRWIHRDVKPDNFLIGVDGHLKISDFGLAFDGQWWHDQKFHHQSRQALVEKLGITLEGDELDRQERQFQGPKQNNPRLPPLLATKDNPEADEPIIDWRNRSQRRRLARSVVGTSQYMAPEVVRGDMYDGRCDWWSIAIIMFECLYGFTPFACDDRHETKLKILQHRKTLHFPRVDPILEPSIAALDLIARLLVEKEKRLCSKQYELNDWVRKLQGGRFVRCHADKTHPDYNGYFVFPDDAEDIKCHPFFKGIDWEHIRHLRPPHVPYVRHCLDTTYFDDEGPVSDIESASTDEDGIAAGHQNTKAIVKQHQGVSSPLPLESQRSQHQQEDQNIVPSTAIKLARTGHIEQPPQHPEMHDQNGLQNPLRKTAKETPSPAETLVDYGNQVDGPFENAVPVPTATKMEKKGKKRPRDIILRDPSTASKAMEIRRCRAFLGYEFRKSAVIEDVVQRAAFGDDLSQAASRFIEQNQHPERNALLQEWMHQDAEGHMTPNAKRP